MFLNFTHNSFNMSLWALIMPCVSFPVMPSMIVIIWVASYIKIFRMLDVIFLKSSTIDECQLRCFHSKLLRLSLIDRSPSFHNQGSVDSILHANLFDVSCTNSWIIRTNCFENTVGLGLVLVLVFRYKPKNFPISLPVESNLLSKYAGINFSS